MKIFWSWQADRSPRLHKFLVRDALQIAIDQLIDADSIDEAERPEVDHDTLNVGGSPDIVTTILRKIEEAAVFVADMTPIGITNPQDNRPNTPVDKLPPPKYLQNPNVMIELGYADRAICQDRILLIANAAHFPGPEALPFDWRHRRGPITYNLPSDASRDQVERARTRLAADIAEILPIMLATAAAGRPPAPPILTRAPADQDPALWAGAEAGVRFKEAGVDTGWKTAHLADGPRLYVRIRAEKWSDGSRQAIGQRMISSNVRLWIGGGYGSTGLNADGAFNASQITEAAPDVYVAWGLTQWFADDGEVWAVDGASFFRQGENWYFNAQTPFAYLANFLDNALRALRGYVADGRIEIELGASGLSDSAMTTGSPLDRAPALADRVSVREIAVNWTHQRRNALLFSFWNKLVDVYGRPAAPNLEAFEQAAAVSLTRAPESAGE